jgi:CopG family transcriptional regulator/antitoxin EndoAI
MRSTRNVSITVPPVLLKQAEALARREGRTKSELFREALRRYVIQSQFRQLQRYGVQQSKRLGLKESDTERLVQEVRRERSGR